MGRDAVVALYGELISSWNARDADGFAATFWDSGTSIGFDGSTQTGQGAIAKHLSTIFSDHETASHVTLVRDVRQLAPGVVLLRAEVGMVPPGQDTVNPGANAVQSLVAVNGDGGWRIALLQNTPAAFHGRPEDAEKLTSELRALLK